MLLAILLAIATMIAPAGTSAARTCCPIVELRQYTMLPGKRDFLINLFDTRFIESQEAAGIAVIGQFRTMDDPNRFHWLQGFQSMNERKQSFERFYHGPAWRTYRGPANTAFLDTDNVLLLHPAHPGSGFPIPTSRRAPIGAAQSEGIALETIYYLPDAASEQSFDRFFESAMRPVVQQAGAKIIATLVTDSSPNTFPALPLRTGVNVFVWFACFQDESALDRYQQVLTGNPRWWDAVGRLALARVFTAPEVWRLSPTPRSSIQC